MSDKYAVGIDHGRPGEDVGTITLGDGTTMTLHGASFTWGDVQQVNGGMQITNRTTNPLTYTMMGVFTSDADLYQAFSGSFESTQQDEPLFNVEVTYLVLDWARIPKSHRNRIRHGGSSKDRRRRRRAANRYGREVVVSVDGCRVNFEEGA